MIESTSKHLIYIQISSETPDLCKHKSLRSTMGLPSDPHLVRLTCGGVKIKLPWPHSADKHI